MCHNFVPCKWYTPCYILLHDIVNVYKRDLSWQERWASIFSSETFFKLTSCISWMNFSLLNILPVEFSNKHFYLMPYLSDFISIKSDQRITWLQKHHLLIHCQQKVSPTFALTHGCKCVEKNTHCDTLVNLVLSTSTVFLLLHEVHVPHPCCQQLHSVNAMQNISSYSQLLMHSSSTKKYLKTFQVFLPNQQKN